MQITVFSDFNVLGGNCNWSQFGLIKAGLFHSRVVNTWNKQ